MARSESRSLTRFLLVCIFYVVGATGAVESQCSADSKWLPHTPAPHLEDPNSPANDCPFYQDAWQNFLFATQPDKSGEPAFFAYKDIEELFGTLAGPFPRLSRRPSIRLAPRGPEQPHSGPSAPGVGQAGFSGILIDQHGRPIYYGINVNQDFDKFLTVQNLKTKAGLINADKSLRFPSGVVELKSSWQIVDRSHRAKNYITAQAIVPLLRVLDHHLVIDPSKTRKVTVALLALHVVFTLDNHPEFVWSTFEHVDSSGTSDLAPAASSNPTGSSDDPVISNRGYTLYRAGTTASKANMLVVTDQTEDPPFDEASQTFKKSGDLLQTSIYRMFPGSKSDVSTVDDQVASLNDSVAMLFKSIGKKDVRSNYRLMGAVWLKQGQKAFTLNTVFDDGKSTDDPTSLLQGEDRLSSMGMESFTQTSFQHCFMCHSTTPVTDNQGNLIISEKLLNVSHVMSKFLASQPHSSSDKPTRKDQHADGR